MAFPSKKLTFHWVFPKTPTSSTHWRVGKMRPIAWMVGIFPGPISFDVHVFKVSRDFFI